MTARKSFLQFQCVFSVSNLKWHSDLCFIASSRRRLTQMLTSSATDPNTIFGQESTTLKTLKKQTHNTERHLRSECDKTHFVLVKKALVYDRDYCLEYYFLSFFLQIKLCFPIHLPSAKIHRNMQHFRGKRTERSNNTVKEGLQQTLWFHYIDHEFTHDYRTERNKCCVCLWFEHTELKSM